MDRRSRNKIQLFSHKIICIKKHFSYKHHSNLLASSNTMAGMKCTVLPVQIMNINNSLFNPLSWKEKVGIAANTLNKRREYRQWVVLQLWGWTRG
jgi:hypothetical protein